MARDLADALPQFARHVTDMPALEEFLNHAVEQGASDIYLQSGHRPSLKASGVLRPFAPYKLQTEQVERFGAIVVAQQPESST